MIVIKSIKLQDFKGIESAQIELGRGLNVLYGANETGKSSFVAAVRAAFLLPFRSLDAKEYVTWGTDRTPRVGLTFDAHGTTYRISKAFGTGPSGNATLYRLKGNDLFEEANGRAVDGKLRRLLAWGIPEPGGKGAPHGLPESYLTNALLGRQDDVTSILTANIGQDRSDTGKALLTRALEVAGQSLLVAEIIRDLEERTGKVFTPTGQRTRAADSPLVIKTREIEEHQRRVRALQDECLKSNEVEERIERLQREVANAEQEQERGRALFDAAQKASSIEQQLAALKTHERQIDGQRDLVTKLQSEAAAAADRLQQVKRQHDQLESQVTGVRTRLATANEKKAHLEEFYVRSNHERRESLTARLRATTEAAQAILKADLDAADRAAEVAAAQEAVSRATCAVKEAETQLRYAQLLEQQEARRQHQERENEARAQMAEAVEAARRLETDLQRAEERLEQSKRAVSAKDGLERLKAQSHRIGIKRSEIDSVQAELRQAERARQNAEDRLNTLEQRLIDARGRQAQLEGERDSHRESADSFKRSRRLSLFADKNRLEEEFRQAQAALDAKCALAHCEKHLEEQTKTLAAAEASLDRAKKVVSCAEFMESRRRAEIAARTHATAATEIREARADVTRLDADVVKVESALADAKRQLSELRKAAKERDAANSRINGLRASLLQAAEERQRALSLIGQLQEIGTLGREHKQKRNELKTIDATINRVAQQLSDSQHALNRGNRASKQLRMATWALGLMTLAAAAGAILPERRMVLIATDAALVLGFVFCFLRLRGSRQKMHQLQDRESAAEKDRGGLSSQRTSLQAGIERIEKDFKAKCRAFSDPGSHYQKVRSELNVIESRLSELGADFRLCQEQIAVLLEATPDRINSAEDRVQQTYEQSLQMKGALQRALNRRQAAEARLSALDETATDELVRPNADFSPARSELTDEEVNVDSKSAAEQLAARRRELEDAGMALRSAARDRDEARQCLARLSEKLPRPAEELLSDGASMQDKIKQALDSLDHHYETELEQRTKTFDEAAARVGTLQKERDTAHAAFQEIDLRCNDLRAQHDRAQGELTQLTQHFPESAIACARESFEANLAWLKESDPSAEVDDAHLPRLADLCAVQVEELRSQLRAAQDQASDAKAYVRTVVAEDSQSSPDHVERQITELASSDQELRACSLGESQDLLQCARDAFQSAKTSHEVSSKRLADAESRLDSLKASLGEPTSEAVQRLQRDREEITAVLQNLDDTLNQELQQAMAAIEQEQAGIGPLEEQLAAAKNELQAADLARSEAQTKVSEARGTLGELERGWDDELATRLVTEQHEAIERLGERHIEGAPLAKLLQGLQGELESARRFSRAKRSELEGAKGQLKLIGGAVARERLADEEETLQRLQTQADDFEHDCDAEKLLLDTLKSESESHAAHLGRVLTEPVSSRFRELTGQRYAALSIDPSLALGKVTAAGDLRDHELLSVGTRHQLAVLIRLALAAHLQSAILLDDQLVHSDTARLTWFREQMKASVAQYAHQVIVVTCRPLDYVDPCVFEDGYESDREVLNVVDLQRVIIRAGV